MEPLELTIAPSLVVMHFPEASKAPGRLLQTVERISGMGKRFDSVELYASAASGSALAVIRGDLSLRREMAEAARAITSPDHAKVSEAPHESMVDTLASNFAWLSSDATRDRRLRRKLERAFGAPQRKERRYDINLPALVWAGGESRSCNVLNLSLNGLFVGLANPPAIGEQLTVECRLPVSEEPVHVSGRAMHVRTDAQAKLSGRTPGVGLQILEADENSRRALRAFIEVAGLRSHRVLLAERSYDLDLARALESASFIASGASTLSEVANQLTDHFDEVEAIVVSGEEAEKVVYMIRRLGGEDDIAILARTSDREQVPRLLARGVDCVLEGSAKPAAIVEAIRAAAETRPC